MKLRPSLSALLLAATLPCLPLAATAGEDSVTAPQSQRELKVGDKAPDQYKRDDQAIRDWRAKGLPAPEKESHWVRLGERYVLVQITNGVILAIH
ncbi:RcnB family protein [Pseudomonas guariconensis]|uniref:RcnB family protein n=1 Tax=Pseudomonas TaxID=286 RepID=UPI001CE465C7|nr:MULTISPECIES: RcnB family protein [Pseudomonas]MCO7640684.1 RcnB family protein [Pseudomonas sp. S 311-6]MCO7515778.1 RcnB family protein [Pseudomonas putida]MCO7566378.1 RcnB family protein [Pseudomonas mosselii]MCO7597408.1 RcnB family protein [Pseudomonas guariconensis]MCO7605630.1 RcnB family protein [Pseudomonas guariconensis]